MSPTEDELRAALRAGEGGGVDADAVIARARSARHTRRVTLTSVIAAMIVVGGVAAGVATLRGGSGGQPAAEPGRTPRPSVTATIGATTPHSTTRPSTPAATQTVDPSQCPAQSAHLMLPGGGGTGQFGGDGPIFAEPVTRLLVCRYAPSTTTAANSAIEITGAQAQQIADSLNSAPATRPPGPQCASVGQLRLLLRAAGQPDVVVIFGCGYGNDQVTNGTAVRYAWQPPAGTTQLFGLSD